MESIPYCDLVGARTFPSQYARVTVELGAMCPEELPMPTDRLRWHVIEGVHGGGPSGESMVRVSGRHTDVMNFIRDHWGDDTADTIVFGVVGTQ